MDELLNYNLESQNFESNLRVQRINQVNDDIINELDNKVETKYKLVPIEVQPTLLSSNNLVSGCTSLGGKSQTEIEKEIAKKLAEILFNKYVIWKQQLKTHANMVE